MNATGILKSGVTLVFHAGRAYYEELLPLLENHDVEVRIPTEGLMIGERLRLYNKQT
nr:DUF6884 domain-containing protein [Natrinema hispanicum]